MGDSFVVGIVDHLMRSEKAQVEPADAPKPEHDGGQESAAV
jgi:hypothetical protein